MVDRQAIAMGLAGRAPRSADGGLGDCDGLDVRVIWKLRSALDDAESVSKLPERPAAEPALHDLLVRARLGL